MNELPYIFENGAARQMSEDEYANHLATLTNYVPPIPLAVTMRQMRLAIIGVRKTTAVNDAIKAITDSTERAKIQVEWDYGTVVERNAPWFLTIMEGIKYTEADIDALFLKAASL